MKELYLERMFKKAILNIVLICLFVLIRIPAQGSIHSIDKNRNENYSIQAPQQSQILMKSNSRLNKSVFGFLPYWELDSANIRLDLLSHIAIFDFLLTEDGSLLDPPGWPVNWEPVITSAQSSGVKVLMTISNLPVGGVDPDIVTNLINNESAQQLFFNDIKNTIDTYNLDGVILDFEALNIEDRGEPITNFTRELRDSLDVWFESKELSFATPAVNWESYWNLERAC
ncbi:MAG: glycosyl hydrolase family 18 protein [Melioribacteraceae bacterium]|nr:glycosyl hydrolase family 18 protein [Melioribacteraceae bacterium]